MKAGGEGWVVVVEAPLGSELYRKSLALREAVLRQPLGLQVSELELEDDARRQHFCAASHGARWWARCRSSRSTPKRFS